MVRSLWSNPIFYNNMKQPIQPAPSHLNKSDLSERVSREKTDYDSGDVFAQNASLQRKFSHVFQCPNSLSIEEDFQRLLSHFCQDKIVLDYGCYDGNQSQDLLQYSPKALFGIDISEQGIERAKSKFGEQVLFQVMDAHQMTFPDNSFDLVVGRAILHHLDYPVAIREIHRTLKKDGVALFIEPLRDNPLSALYRYLTPRARTKDEMPLSRKQINWANSLFSSHDHRFYNFLSIPFGVVSSLISKDPNNWMMNLCHAIDKKIACSFLRYWMRAVVLVWKK